MAEGATLTDQNHSFVSSRQGSIPSTEKIAQLLETEARNTVSSIEGALKKRLEDCYSQDNTLERRVKRLERDVRSLESEIDVMDDCVGRETVVDLIHEIVPTLISQKKKKDYFYTSESSEEEDSVEIIEVRDKKAVPHALAPLAKQRRRMRPRKVKRIVV